MNDRAFVETRGPASGAAHVFLHGMPGSRLDWQLVVERAPPDARLVLVDLPDFGAAPDSDTPLAGLERAAEEVVRASGEQVRIVGYSFSAFLAARLSHLPNVSAVVAVGGFATLDAATVAMREDLLRQIEAGTLTPSALNDVAVGLFLASERTPELERLVRASLGEVDKSRWIRYLRRTLELGQPELAVRSVRVPLTVVHARRDAAVPFAFGEALAALSAQSRFVAIDSDAHALPLTHAVEVAALVFGR